MSELSIISARASVMVYDDTQKKWVPSGSSSGLSKVQIYHHQQNNTFRVVGRKLQDHEVVINCSIIQGLKYNQATTTFHQWRDSKFVYGLNFSSQQDAEAFARAMMQALEVLCGRLNPPSLPGGMANNGGVAGGGGATTYEEDMGYRTMTREDAAIIQQHQIGTNGNVPVTPTSQSNQNLQQQQLQQSPPQTHHRTSSAPPAPQPPPMSMAPNQQQQYHQQLQQQQQQSPGQAAYAAPGTYGSNQNMAQYSQQPIYVSSNASNQSPHQLSQQPQQLPGLQSHNSNSPIYGSANLQQHQPQQVLPNSVSNNSVYATHQQLQAATVQASPTVPIYGQANGSAQSNYAASPQQHQPQFVPTPPQMPAQPTAGGPPPPPPMMPMMMMTNGSGPPQPPPAPAAPPAPPAPPMQSAVLRMAGGQSIAVPSGPGGPPPPPPPLPVGGLGGGTGGMDMNTLATQLQAAKLKRSQPKQTSPPAENSGSSTSSGGSGAGNYGTIGRSSNGMASMMDEMAKTLARRRAQVDKKEPEQPIDDGRRQWEKSNTLPHKLGGSSNAACGGGGGSSNSGSESPRPTRKRFGSASEETILKQVNGDALSLATPQELENLRLDIIREVRVEINKAKQEILDAIKTEFNRR